MIMGAQVVEHPLHDLEEDKYQGRIAQRRKGLLSDAIIHGVFHQVGTVTPASALMAMKMTESQIFLA
jgi:hypothetical protein